MSVPTFRRQQLFKQSYEPEKNSKIISSIYVILLITLTVIITYYLSNYFQSKKETDKIVTKLEDVDKRLKEEEKNDDIKTVTTYVTPNPYDCTYMGGCSRLYPTYPYYPYINHNYHYNRRHRDILSGGNIDLHKRRRK
jgi:hypothetical protein